MIQKLPRDQIVILRGFQIKLGDDYFDAIFYIVITCDEKYYHIIPPIVDMYILEASTEQVQRTF